jgi:ketosteroid isomerase-like protein
MAGPDPLATFDDLYRYACTERNADAVFALWAADDDITMWGSDEDERAFGQEEVRALAEAVTSSPSELAFEWEDKQVRVEGDVAWVNARGTMWVNGEPSPYRVTAVLLQRDGEWRWHTHSGSEPS